VLLGAISNADDQIVSSLDKSLIEQHLTAVESLSADVKKNSSLLLNNQVTLLAILLNKFEKALKSGMKTKLISGLTKIANDSKCKRSLSKEAKIRLRQFVTKPAKS
jgi:hypothetical protein